MCGIVGFVNYKQDISNYKNILINMNLGHLGPGFFRPKMGHLRPVFFRPNS